MQSIHPKKDILNKIVMNFLVVEGYKKGALKFEKESGIKGKPNPNLSQIMLLKLKR